MERNLSMERINSRADVTSFYIPNLGDVELLADISTHGLNSHQVRNKEERPEFAQFPLLESNLHTGSKVQLFAMHRSDIKLDELQQSQWESLNSLKTSSDISRESLEHSRESVTNGEGGGVLNLFPTEANKKEDFQLNRVLFNASTFSLKQPVKPTMKKSTSSLAYSIQQQSSIGSSVSSLSSGGSVKKKRRNLMKDLANKLQQPNSWLVKYQIEDNDRLQRRWEEHVKDVLNSKDSSLMEFFIKVGHSRTESNASLDEKKRFKFWKKEEVAKESVLSDTAGVGVVSLHYAMCIGYDWIWADALRHQKSFMGRFRFKYQPTCQAVNNYEIPGFQDRKMDVLLGFGNGEIVYLNPLSQKYVRLNKEGYYHKHCVTCLMWIPWESNTFLAAFADGTLMVLDLDCEDMQQRSGGVAGSADDSELDDSSLVEENVVYDSKPFNKHSSVQYFLQLVYKQRKRKYNPVSKWKLYSPGRSYAKCTVFDGISEDDVEIYNSSKPFSRCYSPVVTDMQICPHNSHLTAISTNAGAVFFIDLEHSSSILTLNLQGIHYTSYGGAMCAKWSPDGCLLAIGGQDDLVTLIDVEACLNGVNNSILLEGHDSWVNDVQIEQMEPYIDRTISTLSRPKEPEVIYRIWSVGEDCKICVWEVEKKKLIKRKHFASSSSLSSLDRDASRFGVKERRINITENNKRETQRVQCLMVIQES